MTITQLILLFPLECKLPGSAGALLCRGVGAVVDGAQTVANPSGAAQSAIGDFILKLNEGAGRLLTAGLSFWMDPSLSPSVGTGPMSAAILGVQGAMLPLVLLAAFVGVVAAMVRVALTHKSRPFGEAALMVASVIAVTGLATTITQLLITWTDAFAVWMMQWAAAGASVDIPALVLTRPPETVLPAALVTALLVVVASLVQVVFMLFRAAMIPLILVMLPFTAATSQTGAGKQAFHRMLGWLVAFVLYKPIAAVVYAVGLRLVATTVDTTGGGDDVQHWLISTIAGTIIIALAVVALPALIKFCAPMVSSGASSLFSGGTAIMAGVGIATGAVALGASGGAATAGMPRGNTPTVAPSPTAKNGGGPPTGGGDGPSSGGPPPPADGGQPALPASSPQQGATSTGGTSGGGTRAPTPGPAPGPGPAASGGSNSSGSGPAPAGKGPKPPPRTGAGTPLDQALAKLQAAQALAEPLGQATQGADRAVGYHD